MSILAFQKLAGDLSTDGKILDKITELVDNPNNELLTMYKTLYPNHAVQLIQTNFTTWNGTEFPRYWDGNNSSSASYIREFGGVFFGRWSISIIAGGSNDDRDDVVFIDSNGNLISIGNNSERPLFFIGELTRARRLSGYVNFIAHFIGYEVIKNTFLAQLIHSSVFGNLNLAYTSPDNSEFINYTLSSVPSNVVEWEIKEGYSFKVRESFPFTVLINDDYTVNSLLIDGYHTFDYVPTYREKFVFNFIEI
jgi:hypothetical protein